MSHYIPEATPENLQTIKAQVFLMETRELLERTHGVRDFKLEYKIEPTAGRGNADSHFVVLKRGGEDVSQTYIHPRHGDPKSVAYLLFLTSKLVVELEGR